MTDYEKGVLKLRDWHFECRRKELAKSRRDKRLCAPEHLKRGCSWKGEMLMASSFVKVSRRDDGKRTIEYRGGGFYGSNDKTYPQYAVR